MSVSQSPKQSGVRKLVDRMVSTPCSVVMGHVTVLKAMAKAGHIRLHDDTGQKVRHWTGQTLKAVYVDSIPKGQPRQFKFEGQTWELQYVDGCFCPFVCLTGRGRLGFV
jgi:hypothetical protein